MSFFSYLYQIALVLAFFGVVWKFIFIGFVAGSMLWRPLFFVGKAIGYYLLVSLIALQTLVAIEGTSMAWMWFMLLFGAALTFFVIGGGTAEAQKEMNQNMDFEGLELLRYDGVFLIGCVVFFVGAMFFPVLAATPPVFWLAMLIDWVAQIPVIGFLIALYGGWTFLGLLFQMVFLGGMAAVFSLALLYKKTGIGERKAKANAHTDFDSQFPSMARRYSSLEKAIILRIIKMINQEKIAEQTTSMDNLLFHFKDIGNLFFERKMFRRGKIFLHFNSEKGIVVTPTTPEKQIKQFLIQYKIS